MDGKEKDDFYTRIMQIRVKDIKEKVKEEKRKITDEINKNRLLKSEILELVIELNSSDLIEDVDGIHELMKSIYEKYELDNNHSESDLAKLYAEVVDSLKPHKEGEKSDDESECIEDEECSTLKYVELIKFYNELEKRYLLCTCLLNRLEMSNFEHRLTIRRLKEMKNRKIDGANFKNTRNSSERVADHEVEDDICY